MMGWGLFAVLNIYIAILTQEINNQIILINILLAISGIALTTFFKYLVNRFQWQLLTTEKLLFKSSIAVGLLAILYTAWYYILVFLLYKTTLKYVDTSTIIGSWISSCVLLGLWVVIYFVWRYIEQSRTSLINRLKLESEMKDMEIKTLRSNLQPHFIFNSLNSIRALIDEDPNLARLAITKISNILRNSISKQEATDTLRNELQLTLDYLDLEKIRFEDRLQFSTHIDPNTLDTHIPTMMLQTLVENAIKHGISAQEHGGEIKIVSTLENQTLVLHVINTGQLSSETHEQSLGFGLQSSRKRLDHLYGTNAMLQIEEKNKHVIVTIRIKLHQP